MKKNMVYMGDSRASSAERDLLMMDVTEITTAEFLQLAQSAGEVYNEFSAWIKPRMTRERAARVRQLRCDEGWSYRKIAGVTHLEWGKDANWQPLTNQIAGVALCELAAALLGENYQQYPWQANQA